MNRLITTLVAALIALPALAFDPSEKLPDPELEARARALDHEIRCVKCQSESVASSNADWAKDARRAIREQIAAGATDAEVKTWFQERYTDYVLMNPPKTGANLVLWIAAPLAFLTALGVAGALVLRQAKPALPDTLSEEEEKRLADLLSERS